MAGNRQTPSPSPGVDHQFRVEAMTDQCLVELPGLAGPGMHWSFAPAVSRVGVLALLACITGLRV
jgi:hypothetical protein